MAVHRPAFSCIREYVRHSTIDVELRHTYVKPILQNLRQAGSLMRLATVRQLAYCAQLFPSTFSERFCDAIHVCPFKQIWCQACIVLIAVNLLHDAYCFRQIPVLCFFICISDWSYRKQVKIVNVTFDSIECITLCDFYINVPFDQFSQH